MPPGRNGVLAQAVQVLVPLLVNQLGGVRQAEAVRGRRRPPRPPPPRDVGQAVPSFAVPPQSQPACEGGGPDGRGRELSRQSSASHREHAPDRVHQDPGDRELEGKNSIKMHLRTFAFLYFLIAARHPTVRIVLRHPGAAQPVLRPQVPQPGVPSHLHTFVEMPPDRATQNWLGGLPTVWPHHSHMSPHEKAAAFQVEEDDEDERLSDFQDCASSSERE